MIFNYLKQILLYSLLIYNLTSTLQAQDNENFCPEQDIASLYSFINKATDSLHIFLSALQNYCKVINNAPIDQIQKAKIMRNSAYANYLSDYQDCVKLLKQQCPVLFERCPKEWVSPCDDPLNAQTSLSNSG